MALQAANVIDFQAYRQARARKARPSAEAPVSYAMQPVLMWMPFWGFVPMMVMGATSAGVASYGA